MITPMPWLQHDPAGFSCVTPFLFEMIPEAVMAHTSPSALPTEMWRKPEELLEETALPETVRSAKY